MGIGRRNAVASVCRHPDVFRAAIGMSGTYDLEKWLHGQFFDEFYFSSPVHYLPGMGDGPILDMLRQRFVLLAYGNEPSGPGPRRQSSRGPALHLPSVGPASFSLPSRDTIASDKILLVHIVNRRSAAGRTMKMIGDDQVGAKNSAEP